MFDKVSDLKKFLDQHFPEGWADLEPETIISELERVGASHSSKLNDRVEVLRTIEKNPAIVDNGLFFLHAVDVLNNNDADFSHLPHPVSLELGWAIEELKKIYGDAQVLLQHSHAIKHVVSFLLEIEGFTHPTSILADYVLEGKFNGQADPSKEKAMLIYIKGMTDGKSY